MKKDLNRIGKGKGIAWCESLGRDFILMNPEGVYFDKEGKILSDDYKPEKGLKVIKIDHQGNER